MTDLSVTMLSPELGTFLKSAAVSASPDAERPILAAVQVELSPGKIRTVSTDSYTLLIQERDLTGIDFDNKSEGSFLVPAEAIKEWAKSLASRDNKFAPATLTYAAVVDRPGTLTLVLPSASFTADERDGSFPNYSQLVPLEKDWHHEKGAFNPRFFGRMSNVIVPGYDKDAMSSVAWQCKSMDYSKPAVWTCEAPNAGYSATFLQMPVRVS